MEPSEEQTASAEERERSSGARGGAAAEAVLRSLLADLTTLQEYLDERSRRTSELAQRFLANATRDASSRAYDERQSTMLEYQHYIWSEIASRLGKLVMTYEEYVSTEPPSPSSEREKDE